MHFAWVLVCACAPSTEVTPEVPAEGRAMHRRLEAHGASRAHCRGAQPQRTTAERHGAAQAAGGGHAARGLALRMGLGGQGTLMRRAMDGTGLEQRCQQPTGASGLLYGPLEESVKRVSKTQN